MFCSKVDEYGFERPDDFDYQAYEVFITKYLPILTRRAMRWNGILDQKSLSNAAVVKRYVRKGIPAQHRAKVITGLFLSQLVS